MGGRTPINPSSVPYCNAIHYPEFNWVGFKVAQGQGWNAISNYFEFGIGSEGQPLIKRSTNGPALVAAEILTGNYPHDFLQIVELDQYSPDFEHYIQYDLQQLETGSRSLIVRL